MWILPKQLHTSPYVPDTAGLISDLNEQSQACAQSLLVRSKPSPARTWSLKWKRDSWTQLLSGRILKPSHGSSFTAAWTSAVLATRVSHFQPPANASEPKTQDTSGRLSQPELLECDQVSVSLKTSRDISALGFPTCCKTWQEWVTERRGAFSARVKLALRTKERGFLSWPSASTRDHKGGYDNGRIRNGKVSMDTLDVAVQAYRESGLMAWTTPTPWQQEESLESWEARKAKNKAKGYNGNGQGTPLDMQVKILGQAAPASASNNGNRQGWWTPQVQDSKHSGTNPSSNGDRMLLVNQVNWPTVTSSDYRTPPTNSGLDGQAIMPSSEHALPKAAGGKLNPRWVETLMGLPIGWTMPSCTSPQTIAPMSCDSSAMELCLPPQSGLSEFSLAS
jgi:hypothetical protein